MTTRQFAKQNLYFRSVANAKAYLDTLRRTLDRQNLPERVPSSFTASEDPTKKRYWWFQQAKRKIDQARKSKRQKKLLLSHVSRQLQVFTYGAPKVRFSKCGYSEETFRKL